MRLSTNVGIALGEPKSLDEVVAEVRQAADLGLGGAWWAERHTADSLTAVTVAGLAVPELPLGTAVVTTYPRHPLALAGQALTVQAAVGNRLTLGVGPGHRRQVEAELGTSYDQPARHIREYLSVLMPLLRGEVVDFRGEVFQVTGNRRTPGARPPLVLLAALGPRMLRVAGELADGTITVWTGVRAIEQHVRPLITAAAEAVGRPAPRVLVNLPIAVTDDPDAARTWVAEHFHGATTVPAYRRMMELDHASGPGDVVVAGDEHDVERQLARFADAGVAEFVAVPFGPAHQINRTLTLLGGLERQGGVGSRVAART